MSTIADITVPDLGNVKDVPVVDIRVAPGDIVEVNDELITVESDKATIEVPAPFRARIKEVLVGIGAKVSHGTPILRAERLDAAEPARPAPATSVAPPIASVPQSPPALPPIGSAPMPQAAAPPSPAAGLHYAGPAVRMLARELGVDLARVTGTGPKARILREDVLQFVKARVQADPRGMDTSGLLHGLPPWPKPDFAQYGPVERIALSRIRKISGPTLARNWIAIPHVTNFDEADVTELESFRVATNREIESRGGKVTLLAFVMKAAAAALQAFPDFNASLDGEELVLKRYYHLGFAADTPDGLVVPVIRDVDRKGVVQLATEMAGLAAQAREGRLKPADMQGGSFTISSLGGIGGTGFTPIINAPEVAILGTARAQMKPVWDGEQFRPRLIMPISLSWDHRAVDGAAAARFLVHLAALLGDFRRMLL